MLNYDNPIYYELFDFFHTVLDVWIEQGYSSKESRACAFDAVELRFGVKQDRARAIIYQIRDSNRNIQQMRPMFYHKNKELIEILQKVNNEYEKYFC